MLNQGLGITNPRLENTAMPAAEKMGENVSIIERAEPFDSGPSKVKVAPRDFGIVQFDFRKMDNRPKEPLRYKISKNMMTEDCLFRA